MKVWARRNCGRTFWGKEKQEKGQRKCQPRHKSCLTIGQKKTFLELIFNSVWSHRNDILEVKVLTLTFSIVFLWNKSHDVEDGIRFQILKRHVSRSLKNDEKCPRWYLFSDVQLNHRQQTTSNKIWVVSHCILKYSRGVVIEETELAWPHINQDQIYV